MSSNGQYEESIELKVLSRTPATGGKLKRRTPGLQRNTATAVRNDIEMSSGFEDIDIEENINIFGRLVRRVRQTVNRVTTFLWIMALNEGMDVNLNILAPFRMPFQQAINRIECGLFNEADNESMDEEWMDAIEPSTPYEDGTLPIKQETPELTRNTVVVFRNHPTSPKIEMRPEFDDMAMDENLTALEPNIAIQMETPETNRNTVVVFRNDHSSPRVENLPEFEDIVIEENPSVLRRFLNAIERWYTDGWVWFLALHEILHEVLVIHPAFELRYHVVRPPHERFGTPPFTRVFFSNGIRMHAPPREEMPDENLNAFGRFRWHVRQVLDRLINPNPYPNPYPITFHLIELFSFVLGYWLTFWYYVHILPFLAPYLRPLLRPCFQYLASWWYWLSEILEP